MNQHKHHYRHSHKHDHNNNHGQSSKSEKKELAKDVMDSSHEQQAGKDHEHHEHGHEGHDHASMINDFKKRFWVSLIVSIPVILLSEMIQHWFGYKIAFPGDRYVLAVLSSFIFFYGGWPFLKG